MQEHPMYPPVNPARLNEADHAVESFQKIEAAAVALSADKVGRVTADVSIAASIALGAVYNLEKLLPEYEAQLNDGGAAVKAFNALKDCALGALYAHVQSEAVLSENQLSALLTEARPLRQNLLGSAESLANFGLFPETTVSAIREGSGTLDVAKDLIALAALFQSNWEQVAGKVPFERELVTQASVLGTRLLRAAGAQEVGEARVNTALDWPSLRERTFRLLVNTYEVLRRATAYVRWEQGDAATFTPSLHARRVPSKRSTNNAASDSSAAFNSIPSDPSAASEPTDEPLPSSEQGELGGVPAQPGAVIESGLRGAPPFVQ